jgi:tetratricopeptide (TPR) repeat protein
VRRPVAPAAIGFGRQDRAVLIVILGLVLLAYLNSMGGGFVYDDAFQILRNPTLKSASNIPAMFTQGVWQFMNSGSQEAIGLYYRPMFNSLLIVLYQFFELHTLGWHIASIVLHLSSTALLYLLCREWKLSRKGAGLSSLLFGLHPVHVESVAWISGVPDPLAAVFVLVCLVTHYRLRDSDRNGRLWLSVSGVAALFGMMSKEVAIVLPLLIALLELIERVDGESLGRRLVRCSRRAVPTIAAAVVYLIARYAVLGFISKPELKAAGVTTSQVLLTLPSVLLSYARLLAVPYPLAIIYDHPFVDSPGDPRFWGSLLGVAALVIAGVFAGRRSLQARRALVVLLVFLLPVLNLKTFNPNESIVHDRYLYLPSMGFCILLALGLEAVDLRFRSEKASPEKGALPILRRPVGVFVAVICLCLFVLTLLQNYTWQDDVAMCEHALAFASRKPFLHNYLGAYYSEHGQLEEGARQLRLATELDPRYYDAYSNLGDIYLKQQNWPEAEQAYRKAADAGAVYAQTYYNLADVLAKQRKFSEAVAPLQKMIEIQPSNAQAHFYLGWVYQQEGKLAESEAGYAQALRIKPNYLEAHINLGAVYGDEGRFKEALDQLEIARRTAPSHPVMLYTLGEVYRKSDRLQDAITVFTQLIALEPQHPLAHTSLGLCYEKAGEAGKARASFQKAIEVAPHESFTKVSRDHLAKMS